MTFERADRIGTLASAGLHAALILWVALGDWLFRPKPSEPVEVANVSIITETEFAALQAAAPAPPQAAPEPAPAPEPDPAPETTPEPDPLPTPEPVTEPPPEPLPETPPLPQVEQPSPVLTPTISSKPRPRPVPRVADTPAPEAPPDAAPAPDVVQAQTDQPTPEPVEQPRQEPAAPPEATTQIVTEATETAPVEETSAPPTSPRPTKRPKPKPAEPTPAQTATADSAAVDSAVNDALAGLAAEAPTQSSGGNGTEASGPPLTAGEKETMIVAVKECWSLGALSTEAMQTTVTVGFDMQPNGQVVANSVTLLGSAGGSDASVQQAYGAARRAILRCQKNGYPLPPDKYDRWKRIEISFNPENMRLR